MIGLLPLSIGLGLAISLVFTELFGVAAGGMVVPGYLALHLTRPLDVLVTVGSGWLTFALVHALSSVMVIYGRRRTVLTILVGYLVGAGMRWAAVGTLAADDFGVAVIGYIIPGLIAVWLERQGVVETLCALFTSSVAVRLLLVLLGSLEM